MFNVRLGGSLGRETTAIFDWEWTGKGKAPTVTCDLVFYSEDGDVLLDGSFNYTNTVQTSDEDVSQALRAAHPLPEEPEKVSLSCSPF